MVLAGGSVAAVHQSELRQPQTGFSALSMQALTAFDIPVFFGKMANMVMPESSIVMLMQVC